MKRNIAAMLAVMLIMTAFSGVSWAKETVSPAPSASSAGGNAYDDIGAGPSELLGKTELPVDSEAPGDSQLPGDSEAPALNGWQTDASGETFYYQDGVMLKGWQTIDGNTYYFGKKTGKLYRGWQTIGGNRYYLGRTTGKLYTGIHKIRGNVYTFDESGVLLRTVYGDKKAICLTYDDGPSANTASILDTLEQNGGLATFFVVGNRVKSYSKTINRARAMGCQIGNHSYSHTFYSGLTAKEIRQQIKKCNAAVEKAVGEAPVITRTPGGNASDAVKKAVGMPVILWNVDTQDWKTRNAESVYREVMRHAKDGNIVLMHDLYASTAEASKRFIPKLVEQGFQLVTVEEMALLKGTKLKAGQVYFSFR